MFVEGRIVDSSCIGSRLVDGETLTKEQHRLVFRFREWILECRTVEGILVVDPLFLGPGIRVQKSILLQHLRVQRSLVVKRSFLDIDLRNPQRHVHHLLV